MNIQKWHKEVGFEKGAEAVIRTIFSSFESLNYTRHAMNQTIQDRYGIIPTCRVSDLKGVEIFEYTKVDGVLQKVAIRVSNLSKDLDYCYSISVDPNSLFHGTGSVITCWANKKDDIHHTLDRKQYEMVTS